MGRFVLIVAGLLAIVVLLAGPVVVRRAHPTTDCSNRVVVVKGPRGESLECVCIENWMANCFRPGP